MEMLARTKAPSDILANFGDSALKAGWWDLAGEMGSALNLTADASPPASASQGRALQARRDAAAAFAAVLELPRPKGIMAAMIARSAERIS